MTRGIPSAVTKASDRADEILDNIGKTGGDNPGPAPNAPHLSTVENPSQPAQQQSQDTPPAAPQDQQPPQGQDPATAAQPTAAQTDSNWEHKYSVLKNKYDQEVPQLYAQLRDVQARENQYHNQIRGLEAQIQELKSAVPPEPSAEEKARAEKLEAAKSRIIDEYGDEGAGAIFELIDLQAPPVQKPSNGQQDSKVEHLQQEVAQTRNEIYMERLDAMVPERETIARNPEFRAWLNEIEPAAGESRIDLLLKAEEQHNAMQVAYFFNAWKDLKAVPEPSSDPLESQVAPATQTGGDPVPQAPILRQSERMQFYRDYQAGHFRGREEEARRLDDMYTSAALEGRLDFNA